jgi:regulator of cell morphogenesis and NO signaling
METITKDMIINDVVNKYPETMKVFNDYKVDSCCGGGQSIATTAAVSNSNIPELMEALNNAVNKES